MHSIRNVIVQGQMKVEKNLIKDNAADVLTKTVLTAKFRYCLDKASIART